MGFVDEAVITARSGDGGHGCVSFRREKFIPRGGPDGGDGGCGGHVAFRVSASFRTLADFAARTHYRAGNGAPGRGRNQSGKNGADLILAVPPGTVVQDAATHEVLADLVEPGQEIRILQGGRGGRGNQYFATATRRAPRTAQDGRPGEERALRLSLKVLADIGLVGLPNAGKSTLLTRLTAAHPRIGAFPFTTLIPNLGVLHRGDTQDLIIADIPGLIEGASQGRGLGIRFLKHLERTLFLVHLLDITQGGVGEIVAAFQAVNREMSAFSPDLEHKPQLVLINKIDLCPAKEHQLREIRAAFAALGHDILAISALTGEGLDELQRTLPARWDACEKTGGTADSHEH